jgi:uncharacterized membrane protein YfcA
MMYAAIALVSLLASLLTFFSGFGLGTLLLPVFALFFDLETSIALTAIVHFLNNIFKFGLVHKKIEKHIVLKFGIPSLICAFLGAFLLKQISIPSPIFSYSLAGHVFSITYIGIIIGGLMLIFSLWELIPFLKSLSFGKNNLIWGGALSGFFGGLSGHQGALRSAFLVRLHLEKEVFIASGIAIACLVDVARLSIYSTGISEELLSQNYLLLTIAVVSAWVGALAGNKLLKKTTYGFIKWFVFIFMGMISLLIISGILNK